MTKLLLTIDTEHYTQAPGPVEMYPNGAWCTVDGSDCGIALIMELCERYGIRATFFVNVFEYQCLGEPAMARMCDAILDRGHDVQLHTHPAFLTGLPLMSAHSLEQQTELIGLGHARLRAWTGKSAVAHRAGYYAANEDTIAALRANGIRLDCSSFHGRKDCGIHWSKFELAERGGVWELPISWFYPASTHAGSTAKSECQRTCKFDIEKASADTLIRFVDGATLAGYGHITYASHNFSFVLKADGDGYSFDGKKADEFERLLAFVATTAGLGTQTVAELWEDIDGGRVRLRPDASPIVA